MALCSQTAGGDGNRGSGATAQQSEWVLMEGLVYLYSLLCLLQRCAEVFKPASPQMSAQWSSAVRFLPVNVPFPSVVVYGFLWDFSTLIF